ncbi:hypothetical protein D3C84_767700 [compost metagenome]
MVELLTDEMKRQFVLTVWNNKSIRDVEVVIEALDLKPVSKPPGFSSFTESTQNRLFAAGAKQQIDDQLSATGLGPANQRITGDPSDKQRQAKAEPVVIWEYERMGAPNGARVMMKTGAGNCDQMAAAAAIIVCMSGGGADLWSMPGHVFTVVGGPAKGTVSSTIDFSESAFRDAWVVDPWADIICQAKDYKDELANRMRFWSSEGRKVITTHGKPPNLVTEWLAPTDKIWTDRLEEPKIQRT